MSAQQPQRSGQSATAGHDQHPQYTRLSQALDEFQQWCQERGVVVPVVKPDVWVRTNAAHKKPSNKSLAVIEKNDCILAYDHAQGVSYLFPSTRTVEKEQWRSQRAQYVKRVVAEAKRKTLRENRKRCFWDMLMLVS